MIISNFHFPSPTLPIYSLACPFPISYLKKKIHSVQLVLPTCAWVWDPACCYEKSTSGVILQMNESSSP